MEGNSVGGGRDGLTRTVCVESEVEHIHAPRFVLSVVKGPDKGQETLFEGLVLRAGSASHNDFVLSDDSVSRNHFRIDLTSHGRRIRDLDSKNGVIIDDLRVNDAFLPPSCRLTIGDTVLKYREERETVDLELTREGRLGEMLGGSSQMRHLFALVQKVARSQATALVGGESGTGKELVARAIHDLSSRRSGPFEIVDCSAIPETIIESELFGHVKGAFTGAVVARKGAIEAAAGGTLFLDEIGELPLALQAKILRLIERKEVKPVGSDVLKQVDVRIVAATNRDLREEVRAGRFREDLFFRLEVVSLRIPPLREHPEDVPLLVEHFLNMFSARDSKRYTISHSQLARLSAHDYPGNVRELRNMIERSCLLSDGVELEIDPVQRQVSAQGDFDFDSLLSFPYKDAKDTLVSSFEQKYWTRLLELCGGNVSEAARRGGIHRKSLEYLVKKFKD